MRPAEYLAAARQRLRWRWVARLAAGWLAVALGLSLAGAALVMVLVPSATVLAWARLLLYGAAGAAILLAVRHWRRGDRTAEELERRVPAFSGRLLTWRDAARRGAAQRGAAQRGQAGDLFRLLERETAALAAAQPPGRAIPAREIVLPAVACLLLAVALGLLLGGSRPLQLAAQRLWTGELFAATQPRILVAPGNAVVRRGSDVIVNANAVGFRPGALVIHADFGSGWEQAPMTALEDGRYGFVLVGIGDGVDYYVADRGLSSGRFRIDVADLPQLLAVVTRLRSPAWSGLPERQQSSGDVTALPETEVEVTVLADRTLAEPLLVVNDRVVPMTPLQAADAGAVLSASVRGDTEAARPDPAAGAAARGTFTVSGPGSWHVAVRHAGELARISDRYLIELTEDAAPTLSFTWPGHDRKATAIEEVPLEFEASDDFAVTGVTLSYAVNGGAWTSVEIPDGRHLLALENLRAEGDHGDRKLVPGDVVSLYADARDHAQRTRSSLYFVDVRPFEMRYRESQQMAGRGGGEGGGFDIAERQRDLLTATWNLINKRSNQRVDGPGSETARQALADEAQVLAALQRTLAEQVETLVARSAARGLGRDDDTSGFVAELSRALEHMKPAAGHLADEALEAAVPAEQQALKHLATAEASVRDVDVSLSRNQGRGTSGRSLSELVELEMDPERNRYEMPQQPDFGEAAGPPPDERWEQLEALAARQEQLARRPRGSSESLPARWEQARLRRELEQLREQLEANPGGSRGAADRDGVARSVAELDRARRALDAPGGPTEADQQQAAEALRRAAGSLRDASRGALRERIDVAQRRADNLEEDQRRVMEALQQLQAESLERARDGESLARSDYAMQTFAEVKRRMQDDLAALRAELTDISDVAGPAAGADVLERALRELDEVRVDERLAAAASAFDMGQPLYVIGSEALVEEALGRLTRRIDQAARALGEQPGGGATDPLVEVRELRRRLLRAQEEEGTIDRRVVEGVASELARLEGAAAGEDRSGGGGAVVPGLDSGVYRIRGTAPENTQALLKLTLDRLDLAEAALQRREAVSVRAQEPRQAGRDSTSAARYFRALSRAEAGGGPDPESPEGDR